MLFNSFTFGVFFCLFLPLFWLVRRNVFWRNLLLIVASYVFYGWWDPRFLILVAISTSVDYMAALGAAGKPVTRVDRLKAGAFLIAVTGGSMVFASPSDLWLVPLVLLGVAAVGAWLPVIDRMKEQQQRRHWLYLSLFTNLSILGFFKYFNFFAGSMVAALNNLGLDAQPTTFSIILPVGLSFYTFQAISRTIDSYRARFDPQDSIVNYAAYHAFFPQLVAGPIERAAHLMPQFESVRPITRQMLSSGALLFLWGLYQKVVIADNVAPVANSIFGNPLGQSGGATAAGILAFTVQIYCDFCGYSNMARGLARCIGFDLVPNFDLPYFSRSPSEFWTRWHVSLSAWLRDYLYIPLGGSRHGRLRTYRNLMITMLLGGLWHGASWTFVAWGAFHGGIQVLYRIFGIDELLARHRRLAPSSILVNLGCWAATMALIMVGWVLFRARTFDAAALILSNLGSPTGYSLEVFWPVLSYALPLFIVELYQRASGRMEVLASGPFLVRYTATVALLLSLFLFAARGGQEFIYFDF